MLEVYNEKLRDLLSPPPSESKKQPEVHVHPTAGVYVKGVTDEPVDSFENCLQLIEYGNTMKTVVATAMNAKSSRAHTIFKIVVEKQNAEDQSIITSEAFFVDLAGRENERQSKVEGARLVELTFINRSLMWLASCIHSLATQSAEPLSRRPVKPSRDGMMSRFRNSKLTLLLSNALSGNSKTSMIGTLSPALANFEESYSTLNFAATVKNIKVNVQQAQAVDKVALIQSLQEELRMLRDQLSSSEGLAAEVIARKIGWTQALMEGYQKDWAQAQNESKQKMAQRRNTLQKMFSMDLRRFREGKQVIDESCATCLPHLTNYSDDPHLRGRLVFHPIEPGREYCLGHNITNCDFVVPRGLGISNNTCYISRDDAGRLFLRPSSLDADSTSYQSSAGSDSSGEEWGDPDAYLAPSQITQIEINGKRLTDLSAVELRHEDRIVLGRSVMLYAFTQPGGSFYEPPRGKMPVSQMPSKLQLDRDLLLQILGKQRSMEPDQIEKADKYMSNLQSHNLDNEGATSVLEFSVMAQKAARMVEEANQITAEIKPGGEANLQFQLCTFAPVLAYGYGRSDIPAFGVRLVRKVSAVKARDRLSAAVARRASSAATNADVFGHFGSEGAESGITTDDAEVETLYFWTLSKFVARLSLMQEVWEAKAEDPGSFDLEKMNNPWSEQGPGEIAEMRRKYTDLYDRMVSERGSDSQSRTSLAAAARKAKAQLSHLQREVSALQEENRNLRSQLAGMASQMRQHVDKTSPPESYRRGISPRPRVVAQAETYTGNGCSPTSKEGQDGISPSLKAILDVSKANLMLVLDLFNTLSRLSSDMLKASAVCIQPPQSDADHSAVDAARSRLVAAAHDLASFFATSSPELDYLKMEPLKSLLYAGSNSWSPGIPAPVAAVLQTPSPPALASAACRCRSAPALPAVQRTFIKEPVSKAAAYLASRSADSPRRAQSTCLSSSIDSQSQKGTVALECWRRSQK